MTADDWIRDRRALLDAFRKPFMGRSEDIVGLRIMAIEALPLALNALEAVLELHVEGMCSGGYGCEVCEENFPCRTVAAITTALGVESC